MVRKYEAVGYDDVHRLHSLQFAAVPNGHAAAEPDLVTKVAFVERVDADDRTLEAVAVYNFRTAREFDLSLASDEG